MMTPIEYAQILGALGACCYLLWLNLRLHQNRDWVLLTQLGSACLLCGVLVVMGLITTPWVMAFGVMVLTLTFRLRTRLSLKTHPVQ